MKFFDGNPFLEYFFYFVTMNIKNFRLISTNRQLVSTSISDTPQSFTPQSLKLYSILTVKISINKIDCSFPKIV